MALGSSRTFGGRSRTFWFALSPCGAGFVGVISLPLTLVLIGLGTWALGLFALGVWAMYRVLRGWLCLKDGVSDCAVKRYCLTRLS